MRFYFDMDGTIADLYNVQNWLRRLRTNDVKPFREAEPLVDGKKLQEVCAKLEEQGHTFGVITWTPPYSDAAFMREVEDAKKEWLANFAPFLLQDFHCLEYGAPKHKIPKRNSKACLIDDNAEVRKNWETKVKRITIDANTDIIKALTAFVT